MSNDEQPIKEKAGETNDALDALVASMLDSLDERLARLEEPAKKTLVEKIQKNGSLVALAVGILLSLISLYDIFWNKPRESQLRALEEFNKTVNAVASLRQSAMQIQFQAQNNHQMSMAVASMVMPQILAHIQYAKVLLPAVGDHVGIPQLIVLISESMNIYDWRSSETFVNTALASKDQIPSMQSELHRLQGRLLFTTGKVQEGRGAYEKSLNSLRQESSFGINGNRAYIVAEWSSMEYLLGDCGAGNERIREFMGFVNQSAVAQNHRLGLISMLKGNLHQTLGNSPRCALPPEFVALQ